MADVLERCGVAWLPGTHGVRFHSFEATAITGAEMPIQIHTCSCYDNA